MTKNEKRLLEEASHEYALQRITELEQELSDMRRKANDRLHQLQKLDPQKYGELKVRQPDWYEMSR